MAIAAFGLRAALYLFTGIANTTDKTDLFLFSYSKILVAAILFLLSYSFHISRIILSPKQLTRNYVISQIADGDSFVLCWGSVDARCGSEGNVRCA